MRSKITLGIVPLCCAFACLSVHTLNAQVNTDKEALNRAYTLFHQSETNSYNRALQLAAQRNWPLILKGRHGKYALLSGVDFREKPIYKVVDNLSSAQTVGTTSLWPGGSTGLSLTGNAANMKGKLAIWDGGAVRGTHVELAGRVIQKDGATTLDDHATHTSGTMIATGVNPQAKGMSFQAPELDAYDFNNDVSEMTAAAPGLYLSNHSYGTIAGWFLNTENNHWEWYGNSGDTTDYNFGYYDQFTMYRDSIAYNAPFYLIVQAASNNRGETGPPIDSPYYTINNQGNEVAAGARPVKLSSNAFFHTIPTYGNAKNVMTVGAIEPIPNGYSTPSDVVMTYFSSWGPTDDGRIKPDIVADGDGVLSSISTSDFSYDTYSGTSMSTPNVTGTLFLLQQYYTKLHHDTAMRSATLKALAIHTADEAGTAPGPDYIFGWGLLDARNAAGVITSSVTDGSQLILEKTLTNAAATDTFSIPVVASGKGPLLATIAWTDPPGPVNTANLFSTSPELVSDLDLRIIRGSTVFKPWVLNPAKPANPATKGDNTLDNVEKVEADTVIPGATYIIQVTHKGSLPRGQQAFSLVLSGVGGTAYCASAPTSSAGTRIDSVSLGGVHKLNVSGCTTYSDFTALQASLQSGQTVPLYVHLSSCDASTASRVIKVYIDYDNDGNFTDGGDLVATSAVLPGGATSWSTTFSTPSTVAVGTITRLRIVAEETTDTSVVKPCGPYGNGETQDYTAKFLQPSKDLSVSSLVDPLNPSCADPTQIVSVLIRNNGTTTQKGFPVSATILNGASTVATLTGTYPDTIGAGASVVYTLPGNFNATPSTTYTINASVNLSGDQNTANNSASFSYTVSPAAAVAGTGAASICGSSTDLKITGADSSNSYFWYTSATGGTPVAQGISATTANIPANHTFYFTSGGSGPVGPLNKTTLDTAGGYNAFFGNWVSYHAAVPVTLESARFYTKYHGTIAFIVADVDQSTIDASTGSFSYLPYTTTNIHVYTTSTHPEAPHSDGSTQTNDPADSGAVFFLNIPLPAGNHDIIIESLDSATIFRNGSIPTSPYPVGSTNLFAWTGNSAGVTSTSLGTTYTQYYYFFYDAKLKTTDCTASGSRTAVVAGVSPAPAITQVGDSLISNIGTGNQWYYGGVVLTGATDSIYVAKKSGTYVTTVTDPLTGCTQQSNAINFVLTAVDTVSAPKGLLVSPNPTPGPINISFTVTNTADLTFEVYDIVGQLLYKQVYPAYIGSYSGQLNLSGYADGVYILKITHGDNTTLKKIVVGR
jgi:hypothetical protein